jgi:ATP:ADP antiporter, AAA family
MRRLLARLIDVEDGEISALLASFFLHFALLSGYYILRPLREEMGIAADPRKLPWMFTVTFVTILCVVPVYSWLTTRVARRTLVAFVYRFFIANLIAFFVLWRAGVSPVWVARVFYVWVSVYNVFVVSVFWTLMADTWSSGQGKRLYGFVAAGGTAGAIAGSTLTWALAQTVGTAPLVLAAAALLEVAAQCARRLPMTNKAAEKPVGGGALDGFLHAVARPYLLGIGGMVLLYTITSTFIYLEQARILAARVAGSADRTTIFALQDMFVNGVLVVLQTTVTGRVLTHFGLLVAMSIVPFATATGFVAMLLAPSVLLVASFQAGRRVLHFAFDRPSREVLFTVVPRDDKYKTKSFIDNIAFRGGDVIGGWMYAGLAAAAMPIGVPLCLMWIVIAFLLSRAHDRRVREGVTR